MKFFIRNGPSRPRLLTKQAGTMIHTHLWVLGTSTWTKLDKHVDLRPSIWSLLDVRHYRFVLPPQRQYEPKGIYKLDLIMEVYLSNCFPTENNEPADGPVSWTG